MGFSGGLVEDNIVGGEEVAEAVGGGLPAEAADEELALDEVIVDDIVKGIDGVGGGGWRCSGGFQGAARW